MNCKPNDLAIIICTRCTPEIIGRIVEVVAPTSTGDVYQTSQGETSVAVGGGIAWRVRSNVQLAWRFDNEKTAYAFEVPMYDAYLRPVSGLPIEEEARDEVPA